MDKKYTRREAIKYGGKVAAWAGTGGVLGHLYKSGKDIIFNNSPEFLKEMVSEDYKLQKEKKDLEKKDNSVFSNLFKSSKKEKKKIYEKNIKKRKKEISRRGFLEKVFMLGHENPKTATSIAFGSYGLARGYFTGKEKRKVADLRNKEIERDKYIKYLENEMESYKEKTDKELKGIKGELKILKGLDEKEGGLEEKVNTPLMILGIVGLMISISLSIPNLTGAVISNSQIFSKSTNLFILLISMAMIAYSTKK